MSEAEWVAIDEVTPWDENPRINDGAVKTVADSITRFGWGSPILCRGDGVVIAGHTRLKAAQELGMDKVLVRYMDLDPATAKALALADNKLGEIAEWDDGALAQILIDLDSQDLDLSGLGWSEEELDAILDQPEEGGEYDESRVPDVQADVVSKSGEVYQLGPHRLICGDCTLPDVWDALMGEELLRCVWTDPPYGVSVNVVKSVDEAKALHRRTDGLIVSNDAMTPNETATLWSDAFTQLQRFSEPGAAWYASTAFRSDLWAELVPVMNRFGCKRMLVWVKDRFVMGRGDYHYRHEPIFHGWFSGAARLHPVPRDVDTVFECERPGASKEHPTMKPVQLIRPMLENSTKRNWLVGDPFGGSGSTMIACAMSGRRARLIELDPAYCDVIRRRWTRWAVANNQDPGPGALDE